MKSLWDDIKDWLGDATKVAIKEAEDLTRKGKLKMTIFSLSRKIEKKLAELGGLVYHNLTKAENFDLTSDERVKNYLKEIRKLELTLKRKQKELQEKK
uniref:Four helix bundle protein n=1 Tax=candidate division WOR-3 bacterium TaxID=2052148 RepID=A0A7C6A8P4_UNCW3